MVVLVMTVVMMVMMVMMMMVVMMMVMMTVVEGVAGERQAGTQAGGEQTTGATVGLGKWAVAGRALEPTPASARDLRGPRAPHLQLRGKGGTSREDTCPQGSHGLVPARGRAGLLPELVGSADPQDGWLYPSSL